LKKEIYSKTVLSVTHRHTMRGKKRKGEGERRKVADHEKILVPCFTSTWEGGGEG